MSDLRAITAAFDMRGDFVGARRYGSGHINDTYQALFDQAGRQVRYIVQRLNPAVFREPEKVMENIGRITRHAIELLEREGVPDAHRRTLTCIPARTGCLHWKDESGACWRVHPFIEGASAHDRIATLDQAREAARAFGRFQNLAASLGGPPLHETLPDFHHTPKRLEALEAAVAADPCQRAAGAADEIRFARSRATDCSRVTDLLAAGEIPWRVTHNDTKLNNVLLDDTTGEGVCVIDLDTTMPGSALYDFGDLVRSAAAGAAEDDPSADGPAFRLEVFEALAEGYLSAAGFLTECERAHLAFSARLLALECGIRFLTDHLLGDGYFRVTRPLQNLDRCRSQFAMVREIEGQQSAMEAVIARLAVS